MSGQATIQHNGKLAYEWFIRYRDGSCRSQTDKRGVEFNQGGVVPSRVLFTDVAELGWEPKTALPHPFNQRFGFQVQDGQVPFFFRRGYLTVGAGEMFAYYVGYREYAADQSVSKTWALVITPPMQFVSIGPTGQLIPGPSFEGSVDEVSDINAVSAIERWQAKLHR